MGGQGGDVWRVGGGGGAWAENSLGWRTGRGGRCGDGERGMGVVGQSGMWL